MLSFLWRQQANKLPAKQLQRGRSKMSHVPERAVVPARRVTQRERLVASGARSIFAFPANRGLKEGINALQSLAKLERGFEWAPSCGICLKAIVPANEINFRFGVFGFKRGFRQRWNELQDRVHGPARILYRSNQVFFGLRVRPAIGAKLGT
jgi:hypothetical protein